MKLSENNAEKLRLLWWLMPDVSLIAKYVALTSKYKEIIIISTYWGQKKNEEFGIPYKDRHSQLLKPK